MPYLSGNLCVCMCVYMYTYIHFIFRERLILFSFFFYEKNLKDFIYNSIKKYKVPRNKSNKKRERKKLVRKA